MNVGDITGSIFVYVGLAGLAFVLLVKILTKFYKQYMVHYEYMNGGSAYDMVKAFSKYGAVKKVMKLSSGVRLQITKVVRYREKG